MNRFMHNKKEIALHLLILPAVIMTLIFAYWPLFGVVIAFQKFKPARGFLGSDWVGLANFRYVFSMPDFYKIIRNTLNISAFKILGGIAVPVTFSLLLNEIRSVKFKRITQTMVYLPNFISWVILASVFKDMLSPSEGIINHVIKALGNKPIMFLGDLTWFPITMIVTDIWKGFGYGTVIYLAALTSIDPALYESAVIDGASRWKQTLHITLPGMAPIIILLSVLSLGNVLNAGFDQIYNLYSPAVYETGDILDTFVYRLGIVNTEFSPAAAVGFFRSIISFLLISISWVLADKLANYRIF
jgi:putative aldouronate transport system permease protein